MAASLMVSVSLFQLTAARRRLVQALFWYKSPKMFQLTAARRRLAIKKLLAIQSSRFNSQPPEGGWLEKPKTATPARSFNSQPPEGGWSVKTRCHGVQGGFNSQPPEGGWMLTMPVIFTNAMFQLTAARRRLGKYTNHHMMPDGVSTHSRPKAAGYSLISYPLRARV